MRALLERPLPAAGDVLALVGMVMTTQVGLHLLSEDEAASSPAFLALAGSIYLVVGMAFLRHPGRLLQQVRRTWLVMLLVGVALASALWSMDPALSVRRGIALAGTTLLALYIVDRYTAGQFLTLLRWTLTLVALACLFTIAFFPETGLHDDKYLGDWRGLFSHKNILGALMALGALLYAFELRRARLNLSGLVTAGGLLMMLMLVFFSGSRTAWVVTAAGLASLPMLRLLRAHWTLAAPGAVALVAAVVLAGVVLSQQTEDVADALGRDLTMTGRTTLWEVTIAYGMDRPWLGHGYGAFWTADAGLSGLLRDAVGWQVSSAHNAYIDLWLELGAVGAGVFTLLLVSMFAALVLRLREREGEVAMWHGVFLVYLLTLGTAGGNFVDQNSLYWVVLVAAASYLSGARARAAVGRRESEPWARPPAPGLRRLQPG